VFFLALGVRFAVTFLRMRHENDKDASPSHSYFDIFGMMVLLMITGLVCYILIMEPELEMIISAAALGMGFILFTLILRLVTGWVWIASFIDTIGAFLTLIFIGFLVYAIFFAPEKGEESSSDAATESTVLPASKK